MVATIGVVLCGLRRLWWLFWSCQPRSALLWQGVLLRCGDLQLLFELDLHHPGLLLLSFDLHWGWLPRTFIHFLAGYSQFQGWAPFLTSGPVHKSPSTSCVDGDFRYFFCNSSLLLDKALLSYWWLMYGLCTFIQHFCNQPAIFAEPFECRAHRGGHSPVPILETEQLAQGSLGFICSSLLCVLQFLLGGG